MRSTEEERSSLKHKNVSSISAMHRGKINDLRTLIFLFAEFLLLELIQDKSILSSSIDVHFFQKRMPDMKFITSIPN